MFYAIRRCHVQILGRRLLGSMRGSSGRGRSKTPYLVKVVQGSSKDQLQNKTQLVARGNRYGEDSWFLTSTPKAEVMGVADGVGGWRHIGIDAGDFAKELMYWCSSNAEQAQFDGNNPRQLLIDAFKELKNKSRNIWGSSTACLVTLDRPTCTLHSANLGDSGFLVLRGNKVLHRSDEQVHGFNIPFQLSQPPNKRLNVFCDEPETAVSTHMPLQEGDLVLLATDGLFDNVPESLLVRHLGPLHGETRTSELQISADRLVELAKNLSLSSNFQSPFALKARANNANYGDGGKPDDITVILAAVALDKK